MWTYINKCNTKLFTFLSLPNFPISLLCVSMLSVPVSATSNSTFNFSFLPFTIYQLQLCMSSGRYTVLGFATTSCLLVLPFCLLVLCQGLQRWRKQRSNTAVSNFHIFTCHLAAIEIIGIFGQFIFFCGTKTNLSLLMPMGVIFFLLSSGGQMFFHFLTSVERYLAVIHPITYRTLKEAKVIRMRNVIISLAWAMSFATPFLTFIKGPIPSMFLTAMVMLYFIAFLFLSLSVAYALSHKGPRREVETRERFGSKLRAYYILLVNLVVLFVRFTGHLVLVIFVVFSFLGTTPPCAFILSEMWFGLPSSFVLPLLYLHKAGQLQCCKRHNQSGECTREEK